MNPELALAAVFREDLVEVARVHRAAFVKGGLSALGLQAVRRYYEWQLEGPHDHFFRLARLDGKVIGFCVSGISRGALSGFLQRNRVFLAAQVVLRPWLLSNEVVRSRISLAGKSLRQRREAEGTALSGTPRDSWGILSIAVRPEARGSGAAVLLMDDAEREARRRGFRCMHLTVATDNHRAIAFYEKLGWRKVPPGEAWAGRMEKELPAP